MKILLLNWQDIKNPLAGGAEKYLFEIFSRIAHLGHDITLLACSFKGALPRETVQGIKIVRAGNRTTFNFTVLRTLKQLIRILRPDILIEDINKVPFYIPWYIRMPHLALLMHLFGKSIFQEVSFPMAHYVYLAEKLIGKAYKQTDFAVLSESTKKDLKALGINDKRIRIISPGVDHTIFNPDFDKKKENLIVHVGRMKRYKCIDHLLLAGKQLKHRGRIFKMILVGDGDDRPRLQRLSEELGLSEIVQFTGYVPEQKKVEIYQKATFLVENSIKEGWGLIIIEANACGTPVIAARSSGLVDALVHRKTGLLYRFGDIHDLTSKMELFLTDREQRARMGSEALRWAQRFTWNDAAKNMMKLITSEACP